MIDRAKFEREVLETLNHHLEPFAPKHGTGTYVFHSTRLEGAYPDTEVVITYSFTDDPKRKEVRDRIWDYVEKYGETDPNDPRAEDLAVLIATYARGG
jgi:hypothetical protein